MAPATDAVVGAVPAAKTGVASATNTVARMVSGALGVAIVGSLVSSLYASDVEGSLVGLPAAAQARRRGVRRRRHCDRRPAAAVSGGGLAATTGDAFSAAMGTRPAHPRGAGRRCGRRGRPLHAAPRGAGTASAKPIADPATGAHETRVVTHHRLRRTRACRPRTASSNIAARMGRWSAHHRKTGDLRLARVRLRRVRRRHVRRRREAGDRGVGPRRVRARGHDPRRGLQAARGRDRADPESTR